MNCVEQRAALGATPAVEPGRGMGHCFALDRRSGPRPARRTGSRPAAGGKTRPAGVPMTHRDRPDEETRGRGPGSQGAESRQIDGRTAGCKKSKASKQALTLFSVCKDVFHTSMRRLITQQQKTLTLQRTLPFCDGVRCARASVFFRAATKLLRTATTSCLSSAQNAVSP